MKKIFLFALSLLASAGLFAQVQVTADKTGTELQAAINAAEAGTTVYVQAGTYEGNFTMKEGVNVSGGWNADFTAQTDYATVLDAKADGRVVNQPADFTKLTVWSNLTIQNGQLAAALSDNGGAGVALMAYGQVNHCLIQNNTFTYGSGNCIGGGVFNNAVGTSTEPLVVDCWIRNNKATHGGGARVAGIIKNSLIEKNSTTNNAAGGVQLHYGGAMYNSIVRENTSGGDMGGVRLTGTKPCTLANCLIINNVATKTIGGLSIENGVHYIYNNTFVGNNQKATNNANRAGVRLNVNSDAVFANNIVWGNTANGEVQADQMEIHATYASDRAATYFRNNAIVHATVGTATIILDKDVNPGFANVAEGDFSLLYTSKLVNAGKDSDAQGETDLDGKARKAGPAVDLGCYELPYYKLTIAAFEHATLTAGTDPLTAGAYELPQGYTTTATIVADEGYSIKSVKLGDAALEPVEGVYTLPALTADVTLTITVEQIMVNLTIAAFEHATLTVTGQGVLPAGTYPVPYGYTTTATLAADEGWNIKSVKLGAEELVAVEGVYTLPAIKADATLTIEVEQIMVNLTVAAFEHATLTVEGVGVTVAGTYPVPYGYTTTATLVADEGYTIKSVKLGEDELVPVEGVYTISALKADVTITITVEKNEVTAIINGQQQAVSRKVLRDGQLLIIRNEATFNAQGQVVK